MTTHHTLAAHHAKLLADSAISPEATDARGYRTVNTKTELKHFGFSNAQASVPALILPVHSVTGEVAFYQMRPDHPRVVHGKPLKYETPRGARMAVDVPPAARPHLGNPKVPLLITEGIRKADAAVSADLCAIDLIGVWNWRGTNEHGGKTILADFENIAFNGREVYVCYDSDVMTKPSVRLACDRLTAVMRQRDAHVRFVLLPPMVDGSKQGLDDYLAAGHSTADLFALMCSELPRQPGDEEPQSESPYRATAGGLVWEKPSRDGTVSTPLTNFTATIVGDVVEDDGTETRHAFELEAEVAGKTHRFSVPASQFAAMHWPTEHLGARAIVYPGFGAKDHARAAIQLLSEDISERRIYTHTGWRVINGERCYLHAGGAVGADGVVAGVEVALPAGLAGFSLPEPPSGDELIIAIRASLGMLTVAPARVTYPLLAGTYRAVLGPSELSQHVTGPTGAGKSEIAALCQQHFGPTMTARRLPGSWDSTANALEALTHAVKDALFVVDDFMPNTRGNDAGRLHRDADRLLRAVGNGSGRQRMRADTSLRPAKLPRALILSTGEDAPRGQSLRARLLLHELGPDDLDMTKLTSCQLDAAAGQYSASMAGFISWLAGKYPDTAGEVALIRDDVLALRQQATGSGMHRRTPEIVAQLAVGFGLFLDYALARGAITGQERDDHSRACWNALGAAARAQAIHQDAGEPARRFIELIVAALTSGRAHVTAKSGIEPDDPQAWGWRSVTVGTGDYPRTEWRAQGLRIGWRDGDDLFLEPDAAYAVARAFGRDGGDEPTIGRDTLAKRLHERGLLFTTEQHLGELSVRRTIGGQRRRVWHLHTSALHQHSESGQSGHDGEHAPASDGHNPDWPDLAAGSSGRWPDPAEPPGHQNSRQHAENGNNGRIGRVSQAIDMGTDTVSEGVPPNGRIPDAVVENPATQPARNPATRNDGRGRLPTPGGGREPDDQQPHVSRNDRCLVCGTGLLWQRERSTGHCRDCAARISIGATS